MALTTPIETQDLRPACCEYTSGRVFYGFKNSVYYSQVLEAESTDNLSKCHQRNDPTSQNLSDLLATDGGVVQINDADDIIEIVSFGNGVLIYALNGVWYLTGDSSGFTATSFQLKKVTNSGCISAKSVVVVESSHLYWSSEGIYAITLDQFGNPAAENFIIGTISSFYSDIGEVEKGKSYGAYDRINKQVEWLYPSSPQTGATDNKEAKDLGLLFDLKSKGMWKQSYKTSLTEGLGDFNACVVATSNVSSPLASVFVTAVLGGATGTQTYSIDFTTKSAVDFKDFGVTYDTAFLETGYETLGSPSHAKSAPYISTHFLRTEKNWIDDGAGGLTLDLPSGCLMKAKWDWNNSSANGRWSPQQQAYKFRRINIPSSAGVFDGGEAVITTKSKMLGRGKALSIRFEQEPNKDMQMLGYTIQFSMKGKM